MVADATAHWSGCPLDTLRSCPAMRCPAGSDKRTRLRGVDLESAVQIDNFLCRNRPVLLGAVRVRVWSLPGRVSVCKGALTSTCICFVCSLCAKCRRHRASCVKTQRLRCCASNAMKISVRRYTLVLAPHPLSIHNTLDPGSFACRNFFNVEYARQCFDALHYSGKRQGHEVVPLARSAHSSPAKPPPTGAPIGMGRGACCMGEARGRNLSVAMYHSFC